jgi:hypothetical protein
LVGGLIGFGTADVFDLDIDLRHRGVTALAVAGSAVGVAVGDRLVRDTDFAVSHSILIDLAAVAGSLGATGVAYMATSPEVDGSANDPPYLMAAALGGAAGFALTYLALHDRPDWSPSRRVPRRAALAPQLGLLPMRTGPPGLSLSGRF